MAEDRHPAISPVVTCSPIEQPTRGLRKRLRVLQVGLIALFVAVGIRLAWIQIVNHQKYHDIAQSQYRAKVSLPAMRGTLYDRNVNVIASNSMLISFAADPKLAVDDARAIASRFSKLFGKPKSYYLDKLKSDRRFVWLERQVDVGYLKKIDTKELEGIVVRYEPKRLYFNDHVAGQLVGTTDIDNKGLAGLELAFDQELRGLDGYVIFQRDGLGNARPSVDYPRVDPINGHNVVLTIDMQLQAIAEKELRKGIELNKAESGIAVIMQPRTGEVLALAQCPAVDPNNFGKYPLQDQKLRAVTDLFEPGSIFKVVTASAALESGLVSPERKFFAENGTYIVPVAGSKPRKIIDTHAEGWITFRDAVAYSSNIVMAKVSDIIGGERLYKTARDYGFGIATNIEFPGELKGVLKKPVEWSRTTLNTLAFGYEVGVTPIQIAAAYAAVANDGILMKPTIFKRETSASGQLVQESQPQAIRRVVSSATAQTMKELFLSVVQYGTGKPAQIPGIRVAGKTGTSKKYVEGHYETGSYTASFVGFFPADDPQILCLVMMDNPRSGSYYGGTVSAPVFRAIAEQIINTTNVLSPPQLSGSYLIASTDELLPAAGQVLDSPRPSVKDDLNKTMRYTRRIPSTNGGIVPDVRGWSVRRAIQVLSAGKFEPVVSGSGTVVGQTPVAGQPAKAGSKVVLICQPRSTASASMN